MDELTEEEYKDFMLLLSAFGYRIIYKFSSSYDNTHDTGIKVLKDLRATKAGVVVDDEIKQKIYQILKENVKGKISNH